MRSNFFRVKFVCTILVAIVIVASRSFSQEDKRSVASLAIQFVADDYIPRVSIFRLKGSAIDKTGKVLVVDRSIQIDYESLGIMNLVAGISFPNQVGSKVEQPVRFYTAERSIATVLNDGVSPRVVEKNTENNI